MNITLEKARSRRYEKVYAVQLLVCEKKHYKIGGTG